MDAALTNKTQPRANLGAVAPTSLFNNTAVSELQLKYIRLSDRPTQIFSRKIPQINFSFQNIYIYFVFQSTFYGRTTVIGNPERYQADDGTQ